MNCRGHKPFLLKPAGKDYLWGGHRLKDDYSKDIDMTPLAETWECSTHPDGLSIVDSGEFKGKTLKEVLQCHPEYVGTNPVCIDGELPILIKFIDAQRKLSVQVHPDDEYAMTNENGQRGKTEMWYVLDAQENAKLVYGFKRTISEQMVRSALETGNIEKYLQYVTVQKNDVFLINAGTVHAIGEGIIIAEIQENSNLTYRLYDYNRVDDQGNKRELHVDKALEVADLHSIKTPRQPMRTLKYRRGMAVELLCSCQYFQVERILMNTRQQSDVSEFHTGSESFFVLLCIEGEGSLLLSENTIQFVKGDCIFIPANSADLKIEGRAQLLQIRC